MQRILSNKEFWIVSVIFILALSLRLPTLASPLIEDEAISFNRYIDKPWDSLIYNYYDTFFFYCQSFPSGFWAKVK